jgi:hypothetical protein
MKKTEKNHSVDSSSVDVWAIVGDANTGKSTMIGHLTYQFGPGENGLGRKGRRDKIYEVLLRNGDYLSIWSRRMALQEAGLTPEAAMQNILERTKDHFLTGQTRNVLVALRDRQHNNLADGDSYLKYFAENGWKLRSLVLMPSIEKAGRYTGLGIHNITLERTPSNEKHSAVSTSIGHRVGHIRNHFGWA